MNEKERKMQLEAAQLQLSPATFDCSLPKYSQISNSHLDDMEKEREFVDSFQRFFMPFIWLIFWPAKFGRIPESKQRQESEARRLITCFIFSVIVEFFFSYNYLVPFIRESIAGSVEVSFQVAVAGFLIIATFYMFLYVCSVLVDFIVLLISLIGSRISWDLSWITTAMGFRMSSETNEFPPDDCIPLNTMPPEPEN